MTSAAHPPAFQLKFWGVRGSIPAPGPTTVRYGGNTTCIDVRCGDMRLAIDGGTGARAFGDELARTGNPVDLTFLMTHLHLDHVQGFPFFAPFLMSGHRLRIYSALHNHAGVEDVLRQLLAQPAFPISMEELRADISFLRLTPGDTLRFGDVTVKTTSLHHPGGVVGYRFEFDGRVYAHCSDWEHPADGSLDPAIIELIRGADLCSIDSTYTEDEYNGVRGPSRRGWGHATHEAALRHSDAAGVKRLLLFHHEPARTDDDLDAIAARLLAGRDDVTIVREGMQVDV
ncbi:MAG: MBL fold metallo-hydrolase [Myxococcota bacterium]